MNQLIIYSLVSKTDYFLVSKNGTQIEWYGDGLEWFNTHQITIEWYAHGDEDHITPPLVKEA